MEFKEQKKYQVLRGVGVFFMFVTGINLLRRSLGLCLEFSRFIYDRVMKDVRPEVKYPDDTFEAACKRHRVNNKKLQSIIKALRQRRALFQFCLLVCTVSVGASLYNLRGLSLVMSVLAWLSSALFLLQNTLRLWQCEKKKLGSVDDFLADGGFAMMLQVGRGTAAALSIVALVFICSLGTPAMAEGEGGDIGIYTDAAKGDPSLAMLAKIVGGVAGVFPGEDTALTATFMVFNTAVLAVSLIFLLWNFGAGVVQTAHEGEFLGKRFSSIWMPIRNVTGVGGLVPMFGGWSACQIIMLWATSIGIGLANLVWQAGYTAVLEHVATPIITPQAAINDNAIKSIIKAQACMIGFNDELDNASTPGYGPGQEEKLFQNDPRFRQHGPAHTNVVKQKPSFWGRKEADGITLSWGGQGKGDYPVDICGGVRIPAESITAVTADPDQKTAFNSTNATAPVLDRENIINAAAIALGKMAKSLLPISRGIVHGQYPNPQQLIDIKRQYLVDLGKAISQEALNANTEFADYMKDGGKSWINAGTIFQKIAAVNLEIQKASNVQIQPIPVNEIKKASVRGINTYSGAQEGILAYEHWMSQYAGTSSASGSASGLAGDGEMELDTLDMAQIYAPFQSEVVNYALQGMTGNSDNLFSGLINTGNILLIKAPAGAATIISGLALAQMGGGVKIIGTGPGNPTGAATFIADIVKYILIFFLVAGTILAVYLPFLPLIIWYGGVLTWAICVLEAVIAAPLWMFTHMEAGGEGMGQKSAHGYLFLLNVLFRPALMIMALIAAWLMLEVFGAFLKESLSVIYGSSAGSYTGISSLVMFFGVLFIFVSLAVITVNKCFGLVDIVPNQVFAWIGGHYNGAGGSDAQKESHSVIAGGASYQRQQAQTSQRNKTIDQNDAAKVQKGSEGQQDYGSKFNK